MIPRRRLLVIALACFAIAGLLAYVLIAEAQCLRCPVRPPTLPPLPSYGAYPAPAPANLDPADWQILTSGTTTTLEWWVHPYADPDSGRLRIMFPPLESGTLNYLWTISPYTVAGYTWLRATFGVVTTSGAPWIGYPWNGCDYPASVRLFLWSLSYRGTEYERWWYVGAVAPLVPTASSAWVVTINADLTDPAGWYSVYGRSGVEAPEAFAAAKAGAQIGVTFGGGCFAGHGVGVADGGADFLLQWLWVE